MKMKTTLRVWIYCMAIPSIISTMYYMASGLQKDEFEILIVPPIPDWVNMIMSAMIVTNVVALIVLVAHPKEWWMKLEELEEEKEKLQKQKEYWQRLREGYNQMWDQHIRDGIFPKDS